MSKSSKFHFELFFPPKARNTQNSAFKQMLNNQGRAKRNLMESQETASGAPLQAGSSGLPLNWSRLRARDGANGSRAGAREAPPRRARGGARPKRSIARRHGNGRSSKQPASPADWADSGEQPRAGGGGCGGGGGGVLPAPGDRGQHATSLRGAPQRNSMDKLVLCALWPRGLHAQPVPPRRMRGRAARGSLVPEVGGRGQGGARLLVRGFQSLGAESTFLTF